MKIILALTIFFCCSAMAQEKKEIEVCVKSSNLDEQFYCDYGIVKVVHIKGQTPIYFSAPPAQPSPTPNKKLKK